MEIKNATMKHSQALGTGPAALKYGGFAPLKLPVNYFHFLD